MTELKFLEIAGIDLTGNYDNYTFLIDRSGTNFYKIIGAFLVDGLAVDGALLISEDHLNQMLAEYDLKIKFVKDNVGYTLKSIDDAARRHLNSKEYRVELVEFIEDEEDDTFVYGLLDIRERRLF